VLQPSITLTCTLPDILPFDLDYHEAGLCMPSEAQVPTSSKVEFDTQMQPCSESGTTHGLKHDKELIMRV
jgi:hypothetical protein